MINLDRVKCFVRVDQDADDNLLLSYIDASRRYIISACGENVNLNDSRAEQIQLMMIGDWYDTRSMYGSGSYSNTVNSMLMQLRLETENTDNERV